MFVLQEVTKEEASKTPGQVHVYQTVTMLNIATTSLTGIEVFHAWKTSSFRNVLDAHSLHKMYVSHQLHEHTEHYPAQSCTSLLKIHIGCVTHCVPCSTQSHKASASTDGLAPTGPPRQAHQSHTHTHTHTHANTHTYTHMHTRTHMHTHAHTRTHTHTRIAFHPHHSLSGMSHFHSRIRHPGQQFVITMATSQYSHST